MSDTTGFLIANEIGTNKYHFGINGRSFILPLVDTGWVYCVLNVYSNKMEVFQNGILTNKIRLENEFRNSTYPLHIGNLGDLRYYVGPIANVTINKTTLSTSFVQTKWASMSKKLTERK